MRGAVVPALAVALLQAFSACGGSSKRGGAQNASHGAGNAAAGAAGIAGTAGRGGSAGSPDSVDCSEPCGVDFPCLHGTCLSIQGCHSGTCGDPADLCARACGDAGCVTIPASGASVAKLQCADGSLPRISQPIEGYGESCNALPDELERLSRCATDSDCGQVLEMFTLCASLPGRPPVARNDADLTELERLLTMFTLDGCSAARRACSCPPGDAKLACTDGHCGWTPAGACPSDQP